MDDPADYDLDPVRPGAAPTIDIPTVGFTDIATVHPVWLRITEALSRWLQYHFAAESRIEHTNLKHYVWTNDETTSKILIGSLAAWNPKQSQHRPAVLIDRLDQQKDMANRGIGDQLQGVRPYSFAHFVEGAHVIHCIGGKDGEVENLAWEVWRELVRFASVARSRLCLMRFLPIKVGRRTQLTEHQNTYTVPITCMYGYSEAWRIFPLDEEVVTNIFTTFTLP